MNGVQEAAGSTPVTRTKDLQGFQGVLTTMKPLLFYAFSKNFLKVVSGVFLLALFSVDIHGCGNVGVSQPDLDFLGRESQLENGYF